MGVYIKGMEMPPACDWCKLAYYCNARKVGEGLDLREFHSRRHKNCPLVKVPEPHGDLIDRDKHVVLPKTTGKIEVVIEAEGE